jgi:conjugative relaxase-like TrwC/TraI family protein
MAWMRIMGAESVAYHRETVLGRGDDYPHQALVYYAERGESPLAWGGSGAVALGLEGAVTEAQYDAVYGPGGAADPTTGRRLVSARRPGLELVVAAHKSVALLGLAGRAEDMHTILDAETDATLGYLDQWMTERGGRRGRAQVRTPTEGLLYTRTRHATSRAADPEPHDHVLIANACRMADDAGGYKAVDTAALRDLLHAATAAGRVASAAKAIELGYAIEADGGPSGKLGHWAIAGVPKKACELFSKRSAEITAATESKGYSTYQARGVAARETRKAKRHTPVEELTGRWTSELASAGLTPETLLAGIEAAAAGRTPPLPRLSGPELAGLVKDTLSAEGPLAAKKVFTRADVMVATGPALFGRDPAELARVTDAVCASPQAVALIGVTGARERAYAPACVLAREAAIDTLVLGQAKRADAPTVSLPAVQTAIAAKERSLGAALTSGQREAVTSVATSGRGVDLILGVAGAGKTTAIDVVRDAFEAAGYQVIGTATSGQAAKTLGREAGIAESRTTASLLWRLSHGRLDLDRSTVLVLDEAGMADDPSVLGLLGAAETAGSKVVVVGDHRQLGAVGPGGSFEGLLARSGGAVHVLDENVRQADPGERAALGELRAGDVGTAVAWYRDHDRIASSPSRDGLLDAMGERWAADVAAGKDTALFAWRRANVEALNERARSAMDQAGQLSGPELVVGERRYRCGDRIVTLGPGSNGELVTSERGTVKNVDPGEASMLARMDDGRSQRFGPDDIANDRLAHGYAVTVHRSQGATVDVAHLYADGGGRELGYVGMSRARQCSTAYVVADDVAQAAEDLEREWSTERRQRWAIDSGTPSTHPLEVEADRHAPERLRSTLHRARLVAERDALAAAIPTDPGPALDAARRQLRQALDERQDLEAGRGRFAGTPEGNAARGLAEAQQRRMAAQRYAGDKDVARSTRRSLRNEAKTWAGHEDAAQATWERVGQPVAERLDAAVAALEHHIDGLSAEVAGYHRWQAAHPEAAQRLDRIDRQLAYLSAKELAVGDIPQPNLRLGRTTGPGSGLGTAIPMAPVSQPDRGSDFGL